MDELFSFISQYHSDFVCVTESWLNSSVVDEAVTMDGYSIFRADRASHRKGGGICVWVKTTFNTSVICNKSYFDEMEFLLLRITRGKFSCLLLTVYFPHGQSMNSSSKQKCLEYITQLIDEQMDIYLDTHTFVVGDFNRINPCFLENGLLVSNVVHCPTRNNVVLDLILIPESLLSAYSQPTVHAPLGSSDHAVLHLKPNKNHYFPTDDTYTEIIDFRDSHLQSVVQYLQSMKFDELFHECDLDEMCSKFYGTLHNCLSTLPRDKIRWTSSDKPWITSTVKVLINKRYAAYRCSNWVLYAHFRDKVKKAIVANKREWGTRMKQNSLSIWKVRDKVIGKSKDSEWLPKCDPNVPVHDLLGRLNSLYISSMQFDPIISQKTPIVVPFTFKKSDVARLLSNVNPMKSPGSDGIPSITWVKLSSVLADPICLIFNKCLEMANLPMLWKQADVVPLPKTKKPNISETRPISLIPMPARLFEKQLMKHYSAEFSKCCDKNQFAYRKQSSASCALIHLTDYVANKLSDPNVRACHLLAIDMEKGFDRVSHNVLITKMIKDNFDPFLITFIENYLTDRYQRVRWKSLHSNYRNITSGIPQGSTVGPTMFSYYVSDLEVKCDVCLIKYADDIIICSPVMKSTNCSRVREAYHEVSHWMDANKMSIKVQKCSQMTISLTSCDDSNKWEINGISAVTEMRILGVSFDQRLNWKAHVEAIFRKASSRMYVLRQLKPFLVKDQLFDIYCACIRSVIEYCCPLFVSLRSHQSKLLEKVQDRCHRTLCGSSNCTCHLFVPLNYRRILLGWKLFETLVNDINHPLHCLSLPRLPVSGKFRIPKSSNSLLHDSFIVVMSRLSNNGFSV